MKTGNKRRIRIIRLVLLMAVLVASQTIGFHTSGQQPLNATLSSNAPFQYIVTILLENNGLCDVTPSLVSCCASWSITTHDPEFVGALNRATLPNYVWLTPNDTDNMHSSSVAVGDAYLATLVPLILSSRMFTTQNAALFIVFDEGSDFCPTGNSKSDCVVAEWAGPAVKKAYTSTTSYDHYSYLSTLEASWNLPSLTSNESSTN